MVPTILAAPRRPVTGSAPFEFACPLYPHAAIPGGKGSECVAVIGLPSAEHSDVLVQRGACLLCGD